MSHSLLRSSLLSEEFRQLISYKPLQYVISTIAVGLLLFFLTLIVGLSSHLTDVSEGLTDKLGMYFYINKDLSGSVANAQVLELIGKLEAVGIHADYLSEEDAVKSLEQRLPTLVQEFHDYNIDTQLPATLYVTLTSEFQHQQLEIILPQYAKLISNISDLNGTSSVRAQEQRVMRALEFSKFLKRSSVGLIIVFSAIVLLVISLLLYYKLKQFEDILSLEQILGATRQQLRSPFLLFVGVVLGGGFLISLVLSVIVAVIGIGQDQSLIYFSQLLDFGAKRLGVWSLFFGNYGMVLLLVMLISLIARLISFGIIERKIRQFE